MDYREFFSALIHLLYSVSKSDKEVHLLEVQEILDIISKDIPHIFPAIPRYSQAKNAAFEREEFKRIYKQQMTEEDAYNHFIQYYNKHQSDFNLDINLLCYQLAVKVAYSHKGVNEDEEQFLVKLKNDLEVD